MKLKINKSQLELFANNFIIVEGKGVQSNKKNLISESMREYKVRVKVGGWFSEIRVGATSSSTAIVAARLLFPHTEVTAWVKRV